MKFSSQWEAQSPTWIIYWRQLAACFYCIDHKIADSTVKPHKNPHNSFKLNQMTLTLVRVVCVFECLKTCINYYYVWCRQKFDWKWSGVQFYSTTFVNYSLNTESFSSTFQSNFNILERKQHVIFGLFSHCKRRQRSARSEIDLFKRQKSIFEVHVRVFRCYHRRRRHYLLLTN